MRHARWALQRRDLLRGLGVGAALLPLLRTSAQANAKPKSLVCVLQTGGYVQPDWQPRNQNLVLESLPMALEPLAKYSNTLLVLPALIPGGPAGGSRYGSLFHGTAAAGGGAFPAAAGATLDQVVGTALGRSRPTLALGVQLDLAPQLDPAPAYRHAFWTGPGAPVEPELDPTATYGRLFGGEATKGEIEPLLGEGRSILDYVRDSLSRFRRRVSSNDKVRIDAHLEGVRRLETKLTSTAVGPHRLCGNGALARGSAPLDLTAGANYARVIDLQCELLVAALKCGVTSVATLQLSDATGANLDPRFAGVLPRRPPFETFRALASAKDAASVAAKRTLDRWFMDRFARLLGELSAAEAPSGRSLLAESLVVWANDQHDGRTPEVAKVPLLVATGSFALPTGRQLDNEQPLPAALATLAEAMGVDQHPFGRALSF